MWLFGACPAQKTYLALGRQAGVKGWLESVKPCALVELQSVLCWLTVLEMIPQTIIGELCGLRGHSKCSHLDFWYKQNIHFCFIAKRIPLALNSIHHSSLNETWDDKRVLTQSTTCLADAAPLTRAGLTVPP